MLFCFQELDIVCFKQIFLRSWFFFFFRRGTYKILNISGDNSCHMKYCEIALQSRRFLPLLMLWFDPL